MDKNKKIKVIMRSVSREVFSRNFAHVRRRLSVFSPSFYATIYRPMGSACGDDKYDTTGVGNHYHDRTVNETGTARRLKRLKKKKKRAITLYTRAHICMLHVDSSSLPFVFYLFIYIFYYPCVQP